MYSWLTDPFTQLLISWFVVELIWKKRKTQLSLLVSHSDIQVRLWYLDNNSMVEPSFTIWFLPKYLTIAWMLLV